MTAGFRDLLELVGLWWHGRPTLACVTASDAYATAVVGADTRVTVTTAADAAATAVVAADEVCT